MLRNRNPVKIIVADDHQMIREGFSTMFQKHQYISIAAEASNGVELVELTTIIKPDVVITDIKMPKMDGIEATRIINEKFPQIGIIAFTMYEEETSIIDMLEAGAQGYLIKSAAKEEIIEAINAIVEHRTYYCRETSTRLAQLITKSKFNPHKKISQSIFSKREKEIIVLICDGFFNKEIASQLNLSVRTVESYRERIQEKMQVKNTAGVVVYAIRKGIYKL
jgi:DNA-binding NarL/FixJ family response regulator